MGILETSPFRFLKQIEWRQSHLSVSSSGDPRRLSQAGGYRNLLQCVTIDTRLYVCGYVGKSTHTHALHKHTQHQFFHSLIRNLLFPYSGQKISGIINICYYCIKGKVNHHQLHFVWWDCGSWGFPGGASGKEPACQCKRPQRCDLIPELGRSPGRGHGNTFQYSYVESPMDSGAWRATVHEVTKSWT